MRNSTCGRALWLGCGVVVIVALGLTCWASGEGSKVPAKTDQVANGLAAQIGVRIKQSGNPDLEKIGMAVAVQARDLQAVKEVFKTMKAQGKDDEYVVLGYAKAMAQSGQSFDALESLKELLARYPKNPAILYEMGMVHMRGGGEGVGIAFIKRALEIDPFYSRANMQLAIWSATNSDNAKAIEYARRVLAVEDPGSPLADKALLLLDKLIPVTKP